MNREQWNKIEALFGQAMELPAQARLAFIDNLATEDSAVRNELRSLIARTGDDGKSIGDIVKQEAAQMFTTEASLVGQVVGHYAITAFVGDGGMGSVFRARDLTLKRDVAIKFLPKEFSHDVERIARFRREAEILASLNHPNIAAIFGIDESSECDFIVMEFVDGETLASRIQRSRIPLNESLAIAEQILDALEAAHDKGVIHRDLKPANIKISSEGIAKVLDFGLAKAVAVHSSNAAAKAPAYVTSTDAGLILGTASYMSPEQAQGKAVDRRTDIFSFGCILYEMITGCRAFDGENVTQIIAGVVQSAPDWSRLPQNTPPTLLRLLRLCLEKNPKNRRGTASDVRLDIEEALTSTHVIASRRNGTRDRLASLFAGIFLLVALLLSIPYFRSTPTVSVMQFEVAPPAGTIFRVPGINMEMAPNGKLLAFFAAREGKPAQLFIRSLDAVEAHAVSGTDGGQGPFWSRDSRFVGFFADKQLKKVDIGTRIVQTICSVAANSADGTWNQNGIIIYGSIDADGLFQVRAEGGTPQQITQVDKLKGERAHLVPQFLPDGQHFIYVVRAGRPDVEGIHLASLGSKDQIRIIDSAWKAQIAAPGQLLFVRNGMLLAQSFDLDELKLKGEPIPIADNVPIVRAISRAAFSVAADGVLVHGYWGHSAPAVEDLSWYDRTGRRLTSVGTDDYRGVDLSPDGNRLAVHLHSESSAGGDVWIKDLLRANANRFTFDASQDNSSPIWSPDGSTIAFSSAREGQFGLYRMSSRNAGAEELLYQSDTPKVPMSWSRDGESLVFVDYDLKTQSDLWILPVIGDRKPQPYLVSPYFETHPQMSPDGHWLAYASGIDVLTTDIFVESYPTPGTKWQVSTNGGVIPRWRGDGKELFYVSPSAQLWAVVVEHGPSGLTVGSPQALFNTNWVNPDHNGAYFTYAVSRDGQKFLLPRPLTRLDSAEEPPYALTVILHWTGLLHK